MKHDGDVPDTIAFTGGELADLIAASIEETIALDTTPKRRVRTLRTSEPPRPPLARPRQAVPTFATTGDSYSIPPLTFTPPHGIPRMSEQRPTYPRMLALGTIGMILGLVIAFSGWQLSHRTAAAATTAPHAKREIVDAKVSLSSPTREKAKKQPLRRLFFVTPAATTTSTSTAPAPPDPGLDKLGDAQLNAPF